MPKDVKAGAMTRFPEEKKKIATAPKKKAQEIVLEDEITPKQTSHYDRGQMPISALRMLDEIFPNNKYMDLEEDGEDDKKFEGGEGEEDPDQNQQSQRAPNETGL